MIRLTVPALDDADYAAVREVLESGYLVQGARVAAFEAAVAEYVGVDHAVAVANCTAALHLSLLGLGVGAGDRVAVTTYSWPATANVIALCGAEPVFVDIDAATFNMDPQRLEDALRAGRVRVVLPVHAFGGMADMAAIRSVAERHGAALVEDAACALGGSLHGVPAGAWGTAGCFSFHPRKAITTGEGGVVTTPDAKLARQLRILRNHGLDPDAPAPDFVAPGYNLRMTEFQAALGRSQMDKLEAVVRRRAELAASYDRRLAGSDTQPPRLLEGSRHVYQSYVVLLPVAGVAARDAIVVELRRRGIEATIGTYHMPLTRYYREQWGYRQGDFPVTDDVAARALTLPLHGALSEADQDHVVESLHAALAGVGSYA